MSNHSDLFCRLADTYRYAKYDNVRSDAKAASKRDGKNFACLTVDAEGQYVWLRYPLITKAAILVQPYYDGAAQMMIAGPAFSKHASDLDAAKRNAKCGLPYEPEDYNTGAAKVSKCMADVEQVERGNIWRALQATFDTHGQEALEIAREMSKKYGTYLVCYQPSLGWSAQRYPNSGTVAYFNITEGAFRNLMHTGKMWAEYCNQELAKAKMNAGKPQVGTRTLESLAALNEPKPTKATETLYNGRTKREILAEVDERKNAEKAQIVAFLKAHFMDAWQTATGEIRFQISTGDTTIRKLAHPSWYGAHAIINIHCK